jgi:hypothetical protein
MKAPIFAAAFLLVSLAAPLEAKSFAWCQVSSGQYEAYLSSIVEIEDGPAAFSALSTGPFGKGFRNYVQGSFDPHASDLDCTKQESRFFAEDYVSVLIAGNPGYKFVKTGWGAAPAKGTADNQVKRGPAQPRAGALRYRR